MYVHTHIWGLGNLRSYYCIKLDLICDKAIWAVQKELEEDKSWKGELSSTKKEKCKNIFYKIMCLWCLLVLSFVHMAQFFIPIDKDGNFEYY